MYLVSSLYASSQLSSLAKTILVGVSNLVEEDVLAIATFGREVF